MVFLHSEWFNPNSQVVIHFFTSLTHPVLNRKWCSCVWKNWNRVALCGDLRLGRSFVILDGFEWKSSSMTLIHWGHNWKCPVVRMKLDVFFLGTFGESFPSLPEFNGRVVRFPNKSQWMKNSKIKSPYWLEWGFILDSLGRWSCYKIHNRKHQPSRQWRHGGGMVVVLSSTLRGHWTRSLGWYFRVGGGDGDAKLGGEQILLGGHRLYQLTWSASGLKMTFWSFFFLEGGEKSFKNETQLVFHLPFRMIGS